MIISADESDPYFHPRLLRANIFLDGVLQRRCVRADDELGVLVIAETAPDGRLMIENGRIKKSVKRGHVEIVLL